MANEEQYCQNCGWMGKPESDVCPKCQKMGCFMSVSKDFKSAPIDENASGTQARI